MMRVIDIDLIDMILLPRCISLSECPMCLCTQSSCPRVEEKRRLRGDDWLQEGVYNVSREPDTATTQRPVPLSCNRARRKQPHRIDEVLNYRTRNYLLKLMVLG